MRARLHQKLHLSLDIFLCEYIASFYGFKCFLNLFNQQEFIHDIVDSTVVRKRANQMAKV